MKEEQKEQSSHDKLSLEQFCQVYVHLLQVCECLP